MTISQREAVKVKAPEVPELPDLPKGLSNEELEPLFNYLIDVNIAFKNYLLISKAGFMLTDESIQEEYEFAQANLDAIHESLGE